MVSNFFKGNKRRKLTVSFFATIILLSSLIVSTLVFFRTFEAEPVDERKISQANYAEFLKKTRIHQRIALQGDDEKSLAALRTVAEVLDRTPTQNTEQRARHHHFQAEFLMNLGRDLEAEKCVADAKQILIENDNVESSAYCEVLLYEGRLLAKKNQTKDAIERYQQSLSCAEALAGFFSEGAGNAQLYLGTAYLSPDLNQPEKALEFFNTYEANLNSSTDDKSIELMNCHKLMAMAYLSMRKYPEAEEKLNLAKETAFAKLPKDHIHCVHIEELAAQLQQLKSKQAH